jgi:hypothetical protein
MTEEKRAYELQTKDFTEMQLQPRRRSSPDSDQAAIYPVSEYIPSPNPRRTFSVSRQVILRLIDWMSK